MKVGQKMPDRRNAEVQLNPIKHACRHAVQFYENDSALIEALGKHIGTALESGDTAIVIATKAHRQGLAEELRLRKINASAAVKAGLFIQLDAAETLASFMVGGGPDKQKFEETVGALVSQAAARTKPGHRLVAFGEMVALLWAEGKRDATLRLEELWNDLAEHYTFDLLCGYPIGVFDRMEHRQLFFSICGEHTEVNPAESYPVHGSDMQRRRSAARLQQKAKALETEIRIGQERVQLLQQVTRAGTWELDIVNDTFSFSSAAAKLLGFPSSSRVRLGQLMDLMYYSGDRETVFANLQAAQRHRKDFKATFRVRQGDGTRIVAMQGKTFYNSGSPLMLGVVSDVTPAAENNAAPAPLGVPGKKAAPAN
jgi:PAS domain-containing protein